MDAYHVVEVHRLRNDPSSFSVAVLGSSVSIWGIIPDQLAEAAGLQHGSVRKLAVQGGTTFDMWELVKRNPERFEGLKVAIVEINPRMLDDDTESGRPRLTVAQHATLDERQTMHLRSERWLQRTDLVLPVYSVRRPLKDVVLDLFNPEPSSTVYPNVAQRLEPFHAGWHVEDLNPEHHYFVNTVTAEAAAHRVFGTWRLSRLYDRSLKQLLSWFKEHSIPVLVHQPPVHPHVADHVAATSRELKGLETYQKYVDQLGLDHAHVFMPMTCLECGIPVHGMRDHTHLNEIGAQAYSQRLGSLLRSMVHPEAQAQDSGRKAAE